MASKTSITFRIPNDMLTKIDKIATDKKVDRTTVLLNMLSHHNEFKDAIEFLLMLFQQNAPNLKIDDSQKFQAMKIVEMLENV